MQVSIGDKVTCSCGIVQNDHCIHTLYVLLKKFKVPPTNPIIWQGIPYLMQLPISIQNWRALCNTNSLKKRKSKRKNINLKSLDMGVVQPIKKSMIFLLSRKTLCAPSAMNK
jgi:hypothetical protein